MGKIKAKRTGSNNFFIVSVLKKWLFHIGRLKKLAVVWLIFVKTMVEREFHMGLFVNNQYQAHT